MFWAYDHHQENNILGDGRALYLSKQRHYRMLILLLILLDFYIFPSYDHHQADILGDVGFNPSTQRDYRRLIYYFYIT
jgi:hypothetical protein